MLSDNSVAAPNACGGSVTITFTVTSDCEADVTCSATFTVLPCITISGTLLWKGDGTTGVALANVALTGDATNNFLSTPVAGTYSLTASVGSNFTVTPTKNIPASLLNGVDAADATAIQQHLTGISPITDFYRLVAADANKSYTISTVDAAIIRQALLGNPSAVAIMNNTKSWRFVPTTVNTPYSNGYTPSGFTAYSLPTFPEKRVLTGASGTVTGENFLGIKVGDVNESGGSGTANPANKPGLPLTWTIQDRVLQAGETVDAVFKASNHTDLAAWQFALRFDPAQLRFEHVEALAPALSLDAAGNFGTYNIAEGELRALWSVAQGVTLEGGTPVFRVRFTAQESGRKLSELLGFDEKALSKVAYTTGLVASDVQLVFLEPSGSTSVGASEGLRAQLLQNRPNPFHGSTQIGFVLPESCEAQLRVFDVSGRLLAERKGQYPAGRQEELFGLGNATGVLYYELTTPFGILTKKMIAAR